MTQISNETILASGLTLEEHQKIILLLGRELNFSELQVFGVMWSEHCSYKSSRKYLKLFPTTGPQVVQGPGENAGVVDIGDNQVVIFKMESHNHPSFIEPYQGAATGVGGILRDVFTMGAEPICLLNSLRFGSPDYPKTKHLVEGVVSGIAGYGNCFGCPTVGGEVYFHESYNLNPLVNVFCLGLATKDRVFYGRAKGVGNPVMYVGSKTGRDGIHGATMASQEFDDKAESKKPNVQVGDPFSEKLLLEACLELMRSDDLVAIQDMGAAGLTSSSVEMASRGGMGIFLNLSKVPAREEGMKPHEFLLSESQERMLLIAKKGTEEKVKKIFEKWDLDVAVIGQITDDGHFRASFNGKEVVNIPVKLLTEAAPVYDRSVEAYGPRDRRSKAKKNTQNDTGGIFKRLISSPNLCSRRWVYRQYDHQVKTNTLILPGADAAVVRIKGTKKAIAVSADCNSRYCYLDPFYGAKLAVMEAARNISCVGAEPLGLTDCLNFGNPENPKIMWQFKRAVEGIREACLALKIPVVSGNVSFYNETNGIPIYPTPTIGMVGLLSDFSSLVTHSFKKEGELIAVIGEDLKSEIDEEALGGSEYLSLIHGIEDALLPKLDLELEVKVQEVIRELISEKIIHSAHDASEGGLSVAIFESTLEAGIGAKIDYPKKVSPEVLLFGEAPSRIVVSFSEEERERFRKICKKYDVAHEIIGKTIDNYYNFNGYFNFSISELKGLWERSFEDIIHD